MRQRESEWVDSWMDEWMLMIMIRIIPFFLLSIFFSLSPLCCFWSAFIFSFIPSWFTFHFSSFLLYRVLSHSSFFSPSLRSLKHFYIHWSIHPFSFSLFLIQGFDSIHPFVCLCYTLNGSFPSNGSETEKEESRAKEWKKKEERK